MSEKVIVVYKKLGETPLECLNLLKVSRSELVGAPLTYAGRLDPMAEGLMIVLVGEECKNKEQYLSLDKTYEFEILVGFETDTHDLLGLITNKVISNSSFDSTQTLQKILDQFVGTFIQKYPSFSSKTVNGKQLFQLYKDDEMPKEIPEHEVTIYDLRQTNSRIISKEELQTEIIRRIKLVHGDFRQEKIIREWLNVFRESNQKEYQIISCVMECSSGTYVRQLVSDISNKVGVPMVTHSIKRTQIGEYNLDDNINT